jgi:predicted ATPase
LLFESAFLSALARGYLGAGQASDGLACVSEALEKCGSSGEGWCAPELLRLQGELLLLDDPGDTTHGSEAAFLQSLQTSREQGAWAWELRTSLSCAKLYAGQNRPSEANLVLAGAIERCGGQAPTGDLAQATSTLAKLQTSVQPQAG